MGLPPSESPPSESPPFRVSPFLGSGSDRDAVLYNTMGQIFRYVTSHYVMLRYVMFRQSPNQTYTPYTKCRAWGAWGAHRGAQGARM